jgi:hypothetical protein
MVLAGAKVAHTLPETEGQAVTGIGSPVRRISYAPLHDAAGARCARGLESVGSGAGEGLSVGLVGGRRAQRLPVADVSQSSGLTPVPLQGIDGAAYLR